jgi:hypothetical protein
MQYFKEIIDSLYLSLGHILTFITKSFSNHGRGSLPGTAIPVLYVVGVIAYAMSILLVVGFVVRFCPHVLCHIRSPTLPYHGQ